MNVNIVFRPADCIQVLIGNPGRLHQVRPAGVAGPRRHQFDFDHAVIQWKRPQFIDPPNLYDRYTFDLANDIHKMPELYIACLSQIFTTCQFHYVNHLPIHHFTQNSCQSDLKMKNRHQTDLSDAGTNFAYFCLVSYANGIKNGLAILHLHSRNPHSSQSVGCIRLI